MSQSMDFDIAIVGGGMVGAALACALGNSALRVCVLESGDPPAPPVDEYDLRVSAVTAGSKSILDAVGAWDTIAARRAAPINGMHVWDEGGDGNIAFDSAELGVPALGYIVENGLILWSLVDTMNRFANVEYRNSVSWGALEPEAGGVRIDLDSGDSLRARLVVGADGAASAVRKAAGIESHGSDFGQKAIVGVVRSERRHDFIARQRFLETGPLAFLPLDDPGACSIVWSARNRRADELLSLDKDGFLDALQDAFGDGLGNLQDIGRRAAFPLFSAHAEGYLGDRMVLVGDAAHRVHPLAGQGLNLGLADIAVLAEVLVDAWASQEDPGAHRVLRRYERWRRGDNALMIAAMEGFNALFTGGGAARRAARNFGLDVFDQMTPVKNRIMAYASGLTGDRPRLLRGISLAEDRK
jgi:2-octaprenylphenol hydroxylase